MKIHVIGASGRTGAAVCRLLLARGITPVAVVRDGGRWAATGLPGAPLCADLADAAALSAALAGATHVVNTAYAAFTRQVLAASPPAARLVLIGTARRYSALPDAASADAAAAEALLLASGRDGVMLHPTMIYGDAQDGTISRLAALIRRAPVLPLPGGGAAMVQPVHRLDLAACIHAALLRPWPAAAAIAVGGPSPLPYAALIRAVAQAARLRMPLLLAVPAGPARWLGRYRPGLLRMLEDRSVDTVRMQGELGVTGRALEQGLAAMFADPRA